MTDADANAVTAYIRKVEIFDGVKVADYSEAVRDGRIQMIGPELLEDFLQHVAGEQLRPGICHEVPLSVVYTPLNGTGNKPVREMLHRIGVSALAVVPEQEKPDGNFPTAPYPNPEIRQAFACAW